MTTRSHSWPSAACALSTETCSPVAGSRRGSPQLLGPQMVDQAAQRRTGGAGQVLVGGVEQRGHRGEIAAGLNTGGAATLTRRQPAPL